MQGIAKRRPTLSAAGSGRVLGAARLAMADASTVAEAAAAPAPVLAGAGDGRIGRLPVNLPVDLCGGDLGGCRSEQEHPCFHPASHPAALFCGWTPGGAPDTPPTRHRDVPGSRAGTE